MQTPLRSLSLPARLRKVLRFLAGEPVRECRIEFLESRIAPAIFVWDAGGGADTSWHNPLNWSPDGVPGESDTAILNIDKTITLTTSANVGTFLHDNVPFVGENST